MKTIKKFLFCILGVSAFACLLAAPRYFLSGNLLFGFLSVLIVIIFALICKIKVGRRKIKEKNIDYDTPEIINPALLEVIAEENLQPEKNSFANNLHLVYSVDPAIENLKEQLVNELKSGKSLAVIAQLVSSKTGLDYKESFRKVHTLSTLYHTSKQLSAMSSARIEQYEYHASLSECTCAICGALDGKHFNLSEAMPGINCPPMHEECHCAIVSYDPEEDQDWIASGITPPKRETYEEWKARRSSLPLHAINDPFVVAAGFASGNLYLKLHYGAILEFDNVPESIYQEMLSSSSVEKFYKKKIKNIYPSKKV